MAERRMFAKSIITSDEFLEMPLSTQALYFHLSMQADDEGFVGNPKTIKRLIGASDDDCKILIAKKYIIALDTGIIVIRHWNVNNCIQKDRFKATTFIQERSLLQLHDRVYTECIQIGSTMDPECIHDVSTMYTECIQIGSTMDPQISIEERKKIINNNNINPSARVRTGARGSCDDGISLKNYPSHATLMEDFNVSPLLKIKLTEFLRNCYLNKHIISNDKLGEIIIKLDMVYGDDEQAKINSVQKAISGGYFDIAENHI